MHVVAQYANAHAGKQLNVALYVALHTEFSIILCPTVMMLHSSLGVLSQVIHEQLKSWSYGMLTICLVSCAPPPAAQASCRYADWYMLR